MTLRCARCHRVLTREPIVIDTRGYGEVCAGKIRPPDLLTPKKRRLFTVRKRAVRSDDRQLVLEVVA